MYMNKPIRIMVAKDLGREEKTYFGGQAFISAKPSAVTYAYDCLETIGDDAGSGYEFSGLIDNLRRIKKSYERDIEPVPFNDKLTGVLVYRLTNPIPLDEGEMKDLTDSLK